MKKDIEGFLKNNHLELDILIKDATIITMNNSETILPHTCLGIKDEKIVYIGDYTEELKADKLIHGNNYVVFPGMYNCHCHMGMSLLLGYAENKCLQKWLEEDIFPAENIIRDHDDSIYYGSLLSIAEMISSGVVSVSDTYFKAYEIARAVVDSGFKANISNSIVSLSDIDSYNFKSDNCYTQLETILADYVPDSNGRLKADAAIHAEYSSHPLAWRQVAEYALEHNLNMQVHLSETKLEHENCIAKYGKTPAQILFENNVFNTNTTVAHAVYTTPEDWCILKQNGVSVAHCPISNLKLASGIAPITEMINRGINVTLGTDSVASNNSYNFFEELKLSSILQKSKYDNASLISSYDALKMATVNGAKAQGRESEGGSIEIGKDADIVIADFDRINCTPSFNILDTLVYSCYPDNIVYNICQGKILFEKGSFTTIDIERVKYESKSFSEMLKKR